MTLPHSAIALVAALLLVTHPAASPVAGGQYPRGLLYGSTSGCAIETRPVAFGTYDVLSGQSISTQGQVIFTCGPLAGGSLRNVRIEISTGGAGSYQRRMSGPAHQLFYNVYPDAAHRTVWGDGSGGSDYYVGSYPPADTPITVPIHGLVPGGQDVGIGQYTDVLQARILF